jgi:hypothetical protein
MAAAVLVAPLTARGQTAPEGEPGSTSGEAAGGSSGWRLYPREKHLLFCATASTAYRINDPFAVGRLAPPTLTVDAAFTLVHLGRFQFGPYLGLQIGFDRGGTQTQFAVVPGAVIQRRFSNLFAFNARVGVPIGIVRGNCPSFQLDATGREGMGAAVNRRFVQVPDTSFCPAVSPGVELAAGGALYLLSGFAVTAEVSFNMYFGDGGIIYPLIGGGIGLLFDYEVLP